MRQPRQTQTAVRTYKDPAGTTWMVYMVAPAGGGSPHLLPPEYKHGWLCFEAEASKRRLVPVPQDWESCDEQRLDAYRKAATDAQRRLAPTSDGRNAPIPALGTEIADIERFFTRRLGASLSLALDSFSRRLSDDTEAPAALRPLIPKLRQAGDAAARGDLDTARKLYEEAVPALKPVLARLERGD